MKWDAALYDGQHAFVSGYGRSLVELLAPRPGERVLDLGCGTGELARDIADRGASVVGVDASPEMIEAARKSYPGLDFQVADAATLPFREAFDAVFSNAALHWVKQAEAAVQGMARALKPGGRLVAEFGGAGNVARLESAVRDALREVAGIPFESPWFFPALGQYASMLESAGFEVRAAWLFDRPTRLEGRDGLRLWYEMFLKDRLAALGPEAREQVLSRCETALADLYAGGGWSADYRRLRLVAVKMR